MNKPGICAVITRKEKDAIRLVEESVDLFEVRIDLIGTGWRQVINHVNKPWIATNRIASEGGKWKGSEEERLKQLLYAADMGADIVDIELQTREISRVITSIKNSSQVLLSFHQLEATPPLKTLEAIVERQLAEGADICKVVTTARSFADNLTVLKLISRFRDKKLISFAMGSTGITSRILSPLAGGYLTYASIAAGRESAQGQLTVRELKDIYRAIL